MNEEYSGDIDPVSSAIAEIHAMMQRVFAEGGADEEGPFFTALLGDVAQGTLSPQDALQKARGKLASRNDYH